MLGVLKNFRSEQIKAVMLRFPMALLFAVLCTLSLIFLIQESFEEDLLFKLAMSTYLGFLSALNTQLIIEHLKNPAQWILNILPVIMAAVSFYIWPQELRHFSYRDVGSFIGLIAMFHLSVSFIPHLKRDELNDFWEYNKDIFLRFAESTFFSAVIFIGVSLAILAMDQLFGMPTNNGKVYLQLFFILGGIFNTIYFLSGFPTEFDDIYRAQSHKSYAIFSEWLMIPITLLYLFILYAFAGKILITWNLPQGWVAKMVLGFSIVGVLTYLLNYKQAGLSKNRLTAMFSNYFFYILTVPTILVFVSIYTRISNYGLTENRYIIVLLGIWLLLNIFCFALTNKKDIRFIPISLFIFIFLALFLPVCNMFTLPLNNQKARFITELEQQGVLQNGQLLKQNDSAVIESQSLHKGLEFFYERKELGFLGAYSSESIDLSLLENLKYDDRNNDLEKIRNKLGIKFNVESDIFDQLVNLSFQKFNYDLEGKGKLLRISANGWGEEKDQIRYEQETNIFRLTLENESVDELDLTSWLGSFPKFQNELIEDQGFVSVNSNAYKYTFMLEHLSFYLKENKRILNSASGLVFIEKINATDK